VKNLMMVCLAALTALALTGCGLAERMVARGVEKAVESATDVSVDADENSITFRGEDGETVTLSGAGAEGTLVDGFPLPIHDGAKVVHSGRLTANGQSTYTAELTFTGDVYAVADFYEQALRDQGIEVSRSEMGAEGETMVVLSGESETKSGWITVVRNEAEDIGTVNLVIGDR